MQDNNVPVNPNLQKHKPKPAMLITNQLSVPYNVTQEVENVVEANCPDIVILDEKYSRYDLPELGRPAHKSITKS
eukprot:7275401-Ditylum_brightwellii.AAC.1